MGNNLIVILIFFQLNLTLKFINCQHPVRLNRMNIRPDQITLSGFQSGGGMAQQVQFSYSSLFSGIGIFSQTYYRCGGGGGLVFFDSRCTRLYNATYDQLYDPNLALSDISMYAHQYLIEPPENLAKTKLYIYAGLNNSFFTADMSLRIIKIYEPFITNPMNIKTRVQNSELLLPSDSFGGRCSEPNDPALENFYIGNCGLSGPLEALQFLIGPKIVKPNLYNMLGLEPLLIFDQTEFFVEEPHYMNNIGFIYIPTNCKKSHTACYLHFYFHGCGSGIDFVGANHVLNSGFLEVAQTNNIIVVFPQNLRSSDRELDDLGCWDTYGYTGPKHATQRGPQVRIVKRILERILGRDIPSTHRKKEYFDFFNYDHFFHDQL